MTSEVVIVDYGVGNLFNVQRALGSLGVHSSLSTDKKEILNAKRLLLPGVGAFEEGMRHLREQGLVDILKQFAASEKPMMGICLGMQLLMSSSEENGQHAGLDLIPGQVLRFQEPLPKTPYKIPHIGWNSLRPGEGAFWDKSLLEGLEQEPFMYFVHSYFVKPQDPRLALAVTSYGRDVFCSVIRQKNIVGCQFHPERSGDQGLQILKNFIFLKG